MTRRPPAAAALLVLGSGYLIGGKP
jgi:hypothetical protein